MRVRAMAFASVSALALLALSALPAAGTTSAANAAAATDTMPSPDATHSQVAVPGITGAAINARIPAAARSSFGKAQRQVAGQAGGRQQTGGTDAGAAAATTLPSSGHYGWGTHNDIWDIGGQATQEVDLNLQLPASDPDTIYAPTFVPAAISCIEMVTVYNNSGSYVAAYDWCANGGLGLFAKLSTLSSLSAYITQTWNGISNVPAYTVQDVQTDPSTNSWTAYLFNYQTHTFDPFWTSAGTDKYSQSGSRWEWFEVYWNLNPNTGQAYYCTDAAGAQWGTTALAYEPYQNFWEEATPSNSHVDSVPSVDTSGCDSLNFQLLTANDDWVVTNG